MLHHTPDLYAQMLSICTGRMLQAHGLAYLQILMHYTNCYLDCLRLTLLHKPPQDCGNAMDELCLQEPEYMHISNVSPDLPIKLTDMETVYDIQKRFAKLRELEKLYRQNHDDARLSIILTEIDRLNLYLEETFGPYGIKNFVDEQRAKAKNTIKREIKYFLNNIKKRNETLYWQLKAHLHIGLKCIWMDD
jgi:hypothetical protein